MGCIRKLTASDQERLFALRLAAYKSAREFRLLQPDALRWSGLDGEGAVLGAFDGQELVSTLRMVGASSAAQASARMGVSVDLPVSSFPAIIIGRVATATGHGKSGIHSLLRYHAISKLVGTPVRSLLGLVYESAPRTHTMRALGYAFSAPRENEDPEVEVITSALLAHLPASGFPSARDYLERLVAPLVSQYPWTGDAIEI